jgi:CheY-like chemotaxis protein
MAARRDLPVSSSPTPQSEPLVLVVDDNPQILELIEAYLEPLPVDVMTAADGQAALDAVRRARPAVILLDIMMPRHSGFEVCRILKADAELAAIPVIMVTALNEEGDHERARESGADDYITKPVNKIELIDRLRAQLAPQGYSI